MDDMWPLVEAQYGAVDWRELDRFVRAGVVEVMTNRVFRIRGAPRSAEQRR